MGKPHKHAELIRAWADGAEIEYYVVSSSKWHGCVENKPAWDTMMEYRIKPEPPKYPATKLSDQELTAFWTNSQHGQFAAGCLRTVADAAIARAIEDGDVVFVPNYVDALKWSWEPMVPASMLEKVAEAVRAELVALMARYSTGCSTYINGEIDLAAIIAKVKEGK